VQGRGLRLGYDGDSEVNKSFSTATNRALSAGRAVVTISIEGGNSGKMRANYRNRQAKGLIFKSGE